MIRSNRIWLWLMAIASACALLGISAASTQRRAKPSAALRLITACALEYKNAGDGFPETLKDLGPNGSACLTSELSTGKANDVAFDYTPLYEPNGSVKHFRVTTKSRIWGQPMSDRLLPYSINLYGDDSGILRWDVGTPTDKSPVYYSEWPWPSFGTGLPEACVVEHWDLIGNQGLASVMGGPCSYLESTEVSPGKFSYIARRYVFTITNRSSQDVPTGYEIHARPQKYPFDGVRAYMVVVNFPRPRSGQYHLADKPQIEVRGTSENREAAESDALVSKDEYLVAVAP